MKAAEIREPVHIGKVVRNALLFNFRGPQGGTVNDVALLEAVDRLFALLEERRIAYLLVGHIALLQYVEGRNTDNIDLIVSPFSLDRLPELCKAGGDRDFVRTTFKVVQVHLLLTSNPLFNEMRLRHTTRQRFVEGEIPCATPEGLVLLKLYALPALYRQGDVSRAALYKTDILMLMHRHQVDPGPILGELETHLSAIELKALHEIVDEILQRIERFHDLFAE